MVFFPFLVLGWLQLEGKDIFTTFDKLRIRICHIWYFHRQQSPKLTVCGYETLSNRMDAKRS
jgi:hypothetical protein